MPQFETVGPDKQQTEGDDLVVNWLTEVRRCVSTRQVNRLRTIVKVEHGFVGVAFAYAEYMEQ